ncbi:MAG: hypothetical protein N2035_05870 [Chthoniobacterales bacterium]|nr:hypothetical protein [Chthoniobacterales bacterium]
MQPPLLLRLYPYFVYSSSHLKTLLNLNPNLKPLFFSYPSQFKITELNPHPKFSYLLIQNYPQADYRPSLTTLAKHSLNP